VSTSQLQPVSSLALPVAEVLNQQSDTTSYQESFNDSSKGEDEGSGGDGAALLIGRPGKNEIVLVHKQQVVKWSPGSRHGWKLLNTYHTISIVLSAEQFLDVVKVASSPAFMFCSAR
jgi:hypothetical protein